jgi:hypothetical protein
MDENKLLLNKAFCIEIESENAKCHPDLGDGRKSYKDNDYFVFEHGGKWYFVPEADEFGGNRTMTLTKLMKLQTLFGVEGVTTVGDLPEVVTEEV